MRIESNNPYFTFYSMSTPFFNYSYNALNNAITTEKLCQYDVDGMQIEEYMVLPYWVITQSEVAPFITFILSKNIHNKECHFLKQEIVVNQKNVDLIVENSRELLRKLFAPIFDKYSFTLKGVLVIERTLVILHQLEINYYDVLVLKHSVLPIAIATVSEILNDGHIHDCKIDESVSTFFADNLELCVLQNERGGIYETPSVYYTCSNTTTLEYDVLFCPPNRTNLHDRSNLHNRSNLHHRTSSRAYKLYDEVIAHNTKCGIIRVCLFLKRHRVEFREVLQIFDNCDSISVMTDENGGTHYVKSQGQVVALSHYEI